MSAPKTLIIVDEAASLAIAFGQSPRGTPMDLGNGTVIAAEQADKVRNVMAEASRKVPPAIAVAILCGIGAGARFDVATGEWSIPTPAPPSDNGIYEVTVLGTWPETKPIDSRREAKRPAPPPPRGPVSMGFHPKPRAR